MHTFLLHTNGFSAILKYPKIEFYKEIRESETI